MKRPIRLRTQLIGVVSIVALLLAVLLGATSTLALRSSLMAQVDESLRDAADRGSGAFDEQGRPDSPEDGAAMPTAAPELDGDGGLAPPWDGDPPSLNVRGQAAGTVSVVVVDGEVSDAGYLDIKGAPMELSDAQVQELLQVGTRPDWVALPDLGTYRAMSVQREDGTTVITAIPWEDSQETLTSYIVVEVIAALAAVALAAMLATVLVRRSLRGLDRVAETATRVSELPLDRGEGVIAERVPAADTDERTEVGQVGASLNRMLGHVENSLAARHESETKVRKFVADASHELRTPLASIRGYTELVLRRGAATGELSEETQHAIGRVSSEGQRMQALVEDLLLLARLDAGRELSRGRVDVVGLAADATSDAHAAGREHGWHLDLPDEAIEPIPGDESRLRQVLANLLTNARVHTPGGTTVTTAVREITDEWFGPAVQVTVADDGPGIDPELLPTLFDRFSRGDSSRARTGEQSSTGLGLAIVDAIVAAHGGRLEVTSTSAGTSFTVTLPRSESDEEGE